MKLLISFLVVILIYAGNAWPDCPSDCQRDYQSEINSCRAQYTDPDDADDLMVCMDDAKREYESCLAECETESNSTEVVNSFLKRVRPITL